MNTETHTDNTFIQHIEKAIKSRILSMQGIQKGLVNETFLAKTASTTLVIQRMNPSIGADRTEDYRRIAAHLAVHSVVLPPIIATWQDDGGFWKASAFVEHDASAPLSELTAYSAAEYLGKVHNALRSLNLVPRNSIAGFHDTPAIFERLRGVANQGNDEVKDLSEFVLRAGEAATPLIGEKQLIHADPKFDNFLFRRTDQGYEVACLIDWDTLMAGHPLLDVGDMMRSFCRNNDGSFDAARFSAIAQGYRRSAGERYTNAEMLNATKLITLELSARFLIDWFEDRYFGWDGKKFPSRKESNLTAARKYVSYARAMP